MMRLEPTDAYENITFRQLRLPAVIALEIVTCEQPFKTHWQIQGAPGMVLPLGVQIL